MPSPPPPPPASPPPPPAPGVVVSARLECGREGGQSVHADHSYRDTWVVQTNISLASAADVVKSSLLPQLGDPYRAWFWYPATQRYGDGPAPVSDPDAAVVHVDPRQDPDNKYVWRVAVSYEGVGDPTTRPVRVRSAHVPYQEHTHLDAYGFAVTNSAGDPFEGGVPVDKDRRRYTVTRSVPLSAWDPTVAMAYENTLNASPWPVPTPGGYAANPAGVVLTVPAGCAKIAEITEEYVERTASPVRAASRWYVDVTAVVDVDLSTYADGTGAQIKRAWRHVVIDQGFQRLLDVPPPPPPPYVQGSPPPPPALPPVTKKAPIQGVYRQSPGPQLLDGTGQPLPAVKGGVLGPKLLPGVPLGPGAPAAAPVRVAVAKNGRLAPPAPGLLSRCPGATSVSLAAGPAHGTATVGADGSFAYAPNHDFTGWDAFAYKATNDAGDSGSATVAVLVGPVPVVIPVDRYLPADWTRSPVAGWLGGL